jgi:hypothetical protein
MSAFPDISDAPKVEGEDWAGTWSEDASGKRTEHTLVICELFEEPYSSLNGLTAILSAKAAKHPGHYVSLVLVDCCLNQDALKELREIPDLHSYNIENVSFCTPKGCENVTGTMEYAEWVSCSGKVNKFNCQVSEYCPCGEADCEFFAIEDNCERIGGKAEVEENDDEGFIDDDPTATSWSLEKEGEVVAKLKQYRLRSVRLYRIPSGSLGRVLAAALATNNNIIEMDCSNTDLGSAVISVEGIELVVAALEANPASRLAFLGLWDGLEGPEISPELQKRLYAVLCRNAWRLEDEPLRAACPVHHNVADVGVDGYVDDYARGVVEQGIAANAANATTDDTV